MIIEFKEDKIHDIATAQFYAWKKAFKGILGETLLSNLKIKDFEENWKNILSIKERENYIWLDENKRGLGFISFGKPKDPTEKADFEIYGIYVHPDFWGKGIGNELMKFGLQIIESKNPKANIVLWTMTNNTLSQTFYHRMGFIKNGKSRTSNRNNEYFEEIQFEI